jgi:hypothetical protein
MIVGILGAALALSREHGWECIAFAMISAAAVSGVVILANRQNGPLIVTTAVCTLAGAMVASCFPEIHPARPPPEPPGLPLDWRLVVGAVLGWLAGRLFALVKRVKLTKPLRESITD